MAGLKDILKNADLHLENKSYFEGRRDPALMLSQEEGSGISFWISTKAAHTDWPQKYMNFAASLKFSGSIKNSPFNYPYMLELLQLPINKDKPDLGTGWGG